jgi:hypothetical protein
MGFAHGELARLKTIGCLNANLFDVLRSYPISITVFVREWTSGIVEGLQIDIFQIGRIVSANPTTIFIVTDIRKGKTETCVTGEIPTFVAMNVPFINLAGAKERQVRIDEEHCVTCCTFRGTDNPAI